MSTPLATGPVMDEQRARILTERIRSTIVHTRESIEKIQRLLTEARDGGAHVALGYGAGEWTRYMADLFADQPLRLPRDQRQALVGYLAGEGMSTRAIAPIVGASHETAAADLRRVRNLTPAVNPETGEVSEDCPSDVATGGEVTSPGVDRSSATESPEVEEPGEEVESPSPSSATPSRPVVGIDGKTYARPEKKAPPRRPLPDQFFDAAYDMGKAIEKVARLTDDDRFPQNVEKVAAKHRNDLIRSRDLLQQVIDQLSNES